MLARIDEEGAEKQIPAYKERWEMRRRRRAAYKRN
jgi:hypothetical protein